MAKKSLGPVTLKRSLVMELLILGVFAALLIRVLLIQTLDFEKYQSLAKEYAQKVHLSNMLVNHIKSLQALLSGAKTTRPDQQLNKLLEKLSSKSTVIQHGIDKYQEIMKLLNIKKKKS